MAQSMGLPGPLTARQVGFEAYVLDRDRGSLLRAGRDVVLRPKTFAVLELLVGNSGRLVSKEALFGAIWPGIAVTDDALVQVIGELRKALGPDGPRLIRTVPRRGYRFEGAVAALVPEPAGIEEAPHALDPPEPAAAQVPHPTTVRRRHRGGLVAGCLAMLALVGMAGLIPAWQGRDIPVPGGSPAQRDARPTIAVLPFALRGGDAARGYLADGLTQDLITALGQFGELTVMSWNAVAPFRDAPASPAGVAQALGVRYQVEGSLRVEGDRAHVGANLIAAEGRILWSGRFEDGISDMFLLQQRMTTEIAGALAIRVTRAEQQRVGAKRASSLEAYDAVLRARPALQSPTRAGIAEARALLREAIRLDPDYAAAQAALAEAEYIAGTWGWAESPGRSLARAQDLAESALVINEADPRASVVLGRVHLLMGRHEQARAAMERVVAINPSDALGLAGLGNVLVWLGEPGAAIEALERARRIDPEMNGIDRFALVMAYVMGGHYLAAIEQARANLRRSPDAVFNHVLIAVAYAQLGQMAETAEAVATIRRAYPTFDASTFGTKLHRTTDLERLRDGLRMTGL